MGTVSWAIDSAPLAARSPGRATLYSDAACRVSRSRRVCSPPARLLHVLPEDVPARVPGVDGEWAGDVYPQAKMDRMNQLRLGRGGWTAESTDPLWACTGCRHCTMYCDHGNEPGLVLLTGRAAAASRGVAHPALTGVPGAVPRARAAADGAQLAAMFPAEQLAASGDGGVLARLRRDRQGRGRHRRGAGAVRAGGARRGEARRRAAGVRGVPAARGGGTAICSAGTRAGSPRRCAGSARSPSTARRACTRCARSTRRRASACGRRSSRSRSCSAGSAEPGVPDPAALGLLPDPCYHARYNGVVEQPRRALAQLAEVRELAWNRTDTECCGGGGSCPRRCRSWPIRWRGGGSPVAGPLRASAGTRWWQNIRAAGAPSRVAISSLSRRVAGAWRRGNSAMKATPDFSIRSRISRA